MLPFSPIPLPMPNAHLHYLSLYCLPPLIPRDGGGNLQCSDSLIGKEGYTPISNHSTYLGRKEVGRRRKKVIIYGKEHSVEGIPIPLPT